MILLENVADAIAEQAPRGARINVERSHWQSAVWLHARVGDREVSHDVSETLLAGGRIDVVSAAIRNFVIAVEHEMPLSWWGMSL